MHVDTAAKSQKKTILDCQSGSSFPRIESQVVATFLSNYDLVLTDSFRQADRKTEVITILSFLPHFFFFFFFGEGGERQKKNITDRCKLS